MTPEDDGRAIRDLMNSVSTVRFTVSGPGKNRLLLGQRARWIVWSTELKEPHNVGPLRAIWKDKEGAMWLETTKIDDMMSLVEREYGEKGVARFPYIEPGIAPSGEFPEEIAKFPRVVTMLKECEKRVADISGKTGVKLEVLYDGETGVTTFRIGAMIADAPTDMNILRQAIITTARVLKEAHDAAVKMVWARWED
ncbi:MAG: hypothetical protein JRN56_02505 [Nitrososphaerota archaeon]|jgi:hypothetical protein|nr:hypothetical protein [Nitrososphaerota archaeon]MDG6911405.1 hypothetical protein [Nitrososphaerota archaeon]MDG6911656.1 hypothetical protein [Nitrososphaerota archaeon]MDG6940558.1 hypothetical protein [Nitrososphaerota archaeon]MDG6960869.1 hypothetical protein [Nitrososphaerota archaeon]